MRGTKKGLASLLALVVLLTSPSAFAKGKKQGLLESAWQTVGEVTSGVAVAEGLGNMLGGGNEPKTVPTPDGGSMPNPRTMNLLIGQAVDLRDVNGTVQRWADRYSGITYEVFHIQRSRLNERITSDFHVAFRQEGAWNTIGRLTSQTADVVVQDYVKDRRVDQRTIEGLQKAHKMGPQTVVIPEITYSAVERAIEGNYSKRLNFEWLQATIKINVFLVDLETGITRQAFEVEGRDEGFLASGIWSLFLKNAGLTYVQQLTNKASKQAAKRAAHLMATIDRGPVRWRDADPLERISGEVLNGTKFKAYRDGLLGDLVEVGKRTWTLKFDDVTEIVKGDEFEIYSATKLGRKDEPTGVFVKVEDIDKKERLVDTYVSKIDPRTTGILPQAAASGQGESVRPSAQGSVKPQATVAERFAQAEPGGMLPFEGEKPGEEFYGFYALVADCVPAKGATTTTWLERGKVVLVVPPAGSKDQPVKGLVGDMEEESGEWIVWILGGPPTADAVGKKVAWDGWRIYPYNPTQKGR